MTTVRIDGQDKNPPPQPPRMLSVPLNATSAINVHLMFQQQQLLQQQQQQQQPMTVSASTYVRTTPLENPNPVIQPVAINTPSQIGIPIAIQQTTSSSIGVGTDNGTGDQFVNRTALFSVGSEPDSARGSIPDDTNSVHSSGSRGTIDSLPDEVARGMLTSLNLSIPNDDGIVTSPSSDNQEFVFDHIQKRGGSNGSYSSLSSPSIPVSPSSNPDEKHVHFQKKWSLNWEDEDKTNDKSVAPKFTDASSFILDDFTEEESRAAEDAESLKATTVAMLRGDEMTAMVKVKSSTEEMGLDLRVISLLEDILCRCEQLGKKMQGCAVRLTPFHLNKMKMADGRAAKERAAQVAKILDGDLVLCEAVCQKNAERLHVATEMRDVVYEKGKFAVGKLGIMVTLWKKHKFAVAREFSEPLCSHIHFYRPHLLGNSSETTIKRKRKATDTVRRVMQSPTLLSQMFKNDPTITVAEAARRSFVDIIFYALYE